MITIADIYVWFSENKWWLIMLVPIIGVIWIVRASR